jgi:hypothetical protein
MCVYVYLPFRDGQWRSKLQLLMIAQSCRSGKETIRGLAIHKESYRSWHITPFSFF